ncbi:MAG: RDD family protein [Sulfurovaceae bacterium]|nr:RDD family protein [Sulfurovaceae bacterium]
MYEEERVEYQIAPTGKRMGAFVIDDIVVTLLLFIIFYKQLIAINMQDPEQLILFLQTNGVYFILLRFFYHLYFTWQSGQTLGKRALKIRIVEVESGTIPSFQVALLRSGLRIISESIFYLGYLVAYFTPMVQTLHDKLSNTVVVDDA